MMTKEHILREVRRTADENGGKPLGRLRFFTETGIRETDWRGKYWVRWNEVLRDAGFGPNMLVEARIIGDRPRFFRFSNARGILARQIIAIEV